MTKQVVWTFRKFFFLQFDTKFASKQQRLAKIGTTLWLLLSTRVIICPSYYIWGLYFILFKVAVAFILQN